MTTCPYGFRIVGPVSEPRRLIDARTAFAAYAACDQRADVHRESYLSAFQFNGDFRDHLNSTGSVRGFVGCCWSGWLWFDIDREGNFESAVEDARRLAVALETRYALHDGNLLVFFSGRKGFHLGLPTALWSPEPSDRFHSVCRHMAETIAEQAAVAIDTAVYDRVRPFRAPNSRHPKTCLHKRRISVDELMGLSVERIVQLSAIPDPFELPTPAQHCSSAASDWIAADEVVDRKANERRQRCASVSGASLNRATLHYIRSGATKGERAVRLYSSAANLSEFGCSFELAYALLSESALDSGLPPQEVRRQIESGLNAPRRTQ